MSELDENDPRRWDHRWSPIDDPHPRYETYRWAITAWNEGAGMGSSHVAGPWGETLEQAIARAEQYQREGDFEGKKYDHVEIVNQRWRTCASTETFTLDEAREML